MIDDEIVDIPSIWKRTRIIYRYSVRKHLDRDRCTHKIVLVDYGVGKYLANRLRRILVDGLPTHIAVVEFPGMNLS